MLNFQGDPGSLREPQGTWKVLRWWNTLCSKGPALGYHPKPTKSWLVVKPDYEDKARAVFKGSDVNITVEGSREEVPRFTNRNTGIL